jgi:Flp pilus assembly protein TadG
MKIVKQEKAMTKLFELRNRRGITLVLMASMLTVLIGASAFAVDFGRMYMYHAQLRSAADASALAGVVTLANGHGTTAADSAVKFDALNRVGDSTNTLVSTDVVPGTWDGTFHPAPLGWTDPTANAVKTTTHYTGTYTFGRVFGFSSKMLTAVAVAVHGSVGKSPCTRPWAVPYRSLLDQLGTGQDSSYNLTPADVIQLSGAVTGVHPIQTLNYSDSTGAAPHQMRAVELPPAQYANGLAGDPQVPASAAVYANEIGRPCASLPSDQTVGVGDWLTGLDGSKVGKTSDGIQLLCTGSTSGGASSVDCTTPAFPDGVPVDVALWDTYLQFGPNCSQSGCYHVKYMGVFFVTSYTKAGNVNNVNGYFGSLKVAAGGFVNAPGPIQKNALVQ